MFRHLLAFVKDLCINSISYQLDYPCFTLFLAVESRDAPSPKQNRLELTLGLTRNLWEAILPFLNSYIRFKLASMYLKTNQIDQITLKAPTRH